VKLDDEDEEIFLDRKSKLKNQMLENIKFIGELYKINLLNEKNNVFMYRSFI